MQNTIEQEFYSQPSLMYKEQNDIGNHATVHKHKPHILADKTQKDKNKEPRNVREPETITHRGKVE